MLQRTTFDNRTWSARIQNGEHFFSSTSPQNGGIYGHLFCSFTTFKREIITFGPFFFQHRPKNWNAMLIAQGHWNFSAHPFCRQALKWMMQELLKMWGPTEFMRTKRSVRLSWLWSSESVRLWSSPLINPQSSDLRQAKVIFCLLSKTLILICENHIFVFSS